MLDVAVLPGIAFCYFCRMPSPLLECLISLVGLCQQALVAMRSFVRRVQVDLLGSPFGPEVDQSLLPCSNSFCKPSYELFHSSSIKTYSGLKLYHEVFQVLDSFLESDSDLPGHPAFLEGRNSYR